MINQVDSDIISDATESVISSFISAFQNILEQIVGNIFDFGGNFISGDLTSNSPALLSLVIVMLASGGILGYKLSKG